MKMALKHLSVVCTMVALTTCAPHPTRLARNAQPVIMKSGGFLRLNPNQAKAILDSNTENSHFWDATNLKIKSDEGNFQDYKLEKTSIKKEVLVDKKGQKKTHRIIEKDYTIDGKPYDLGDGTTIGRIPEDTLLIRRDDNKKTRYTTLDKLFSHPGTGFKNKDLSADSLGGLHPDEVFYADHNLIIIKGGGFPTKIHYLEDNNLGSVVNVTDVRPDDLFAKVPLSLKYLNGNVPTIVKPNSNNPDAVVFKPERSLSKRSDKLTNAAKKDHFEQFFAAPSRKISTRVPSNKKRVVQYHYQSMGPNSRPIVDYKIHKDGSIDDKSFSSVKSPSLKTSPSLKRSRRLPDPIESNEEFATSRPSFKPSIQVPADFSPSIPHHLLRQTTAKPSPPGSVSLHGDTDVNFLPPVPPVNHRAEDFTPRRPGLANPTRFREPQTGSLEPLRPLPVL